MLPLPKSSDLTYQEEFALNVLLGLVRTLVSSLVVLNETVLLGKKKSLGGNKRNRELRKKV